MTFEKIVGQERAIGFLRQALRSGRVAHTYAFVGPAGVGRKLTALAFAQALLCSAPGAAGGGGEACGRCAACGRVERLAHPDLHLIVPDGQTIKIDQVRELEREAWLRAVEGRRKVFIVDEAERMPLATANAFLKTLEEPPANTLIILVLSQVQALPATVLSRCHVVRFVPLPEEDAVALLTSRGFSPIDAVRAARRYGGRVGLALSGEKNEWVAEIDEALSILGEVKGKGPEPVFRHAEAIGRDRAKVESLIENYWLWYRDLLTAKAGGDSRLFIHEDRGAELRQEAEGLSWDAIFGGLDQCRAAWLALAGNTSPRLTLEVTLSRLGLRAA